MFVGFVLSARSWLTTQFCDYRRSTKLVIFLLCESWRSLYSSWVLELKDSRIRGLNRTYTVIFRTRPPGVRWNNCEDINWVLIWFLSSISLVVLLAPFRVSAMVPSPVPSADSLRIASRSWPSLMRWATGQFWDIDRVPLRNFDWFSFTPLRLPSPILHYYTKNNYHLTQNLHTELKFSLCTNGLRHDECH
jgi:hypothetical protein